MNFQPNEAVYESTDRQKEMAQTNLDNNRAIYQKAASIISMNIPDEVSQSYIRNHVEDYRPQEKPLIAEVKNNFIQPVIKRRIFLDEISNEEKEALGLYQANDINNAYIHNEAAQRQSVAPMHTASSSFHSYDILIKKASTIKAANMQKQTVDPQIEQTNKYQTVEENKINTQINNNAVKEGIHHKLTRLQDNNRMLLKDHEKQDLVTFALTGIVNKDEMSQESQMLKTLTNHPGTDMRLVNINSKKNTTYMEDTQSSGGSLKFKVVKLDQSLEEVKERASPSQNSIDEEELLQEDSVSTHSPNIRGGGDRNNIDFPKTIELLPNPCQLTSEMISASSFFKSSATPVQGNVQDLLNDNIFSQSPANALANQHNDIRVEDIKLEEKRTAVFEQTQSGEQKKQVIPEDLRILDQRSLNYFNHNSFIRLLLFNITTSIYYNYFFLVMSLTNNVLLAFYHYEPLYDDTYTTTNQMINYLETGFTILYIMEAFAKLIVLGLYQHRYAYFRDPWNYIDIIIIVTGIFEFIYVPNINQGLIILRNIVRPMKLANHIESLKQEIKSLIQSLPEYSNLGILTVFTFILFSTLGLQQFCGLIYNACRTQEYPDKELKLWTIDQTIQRPCSAYDLGSFSCPSNQWCGNIEKYDGIDFETEGFDKKSYVNFGITNFDHLGGSLLTVFQMIMSETWYFQIMNLMDVDIPFIGAFYVFVVIIVGQFFLLNLLLAVIIQASIKQHQLKLERELKEFKKKLLHDKINGNEIEVSESEVSVLKSSIMTDSSIYEKEDQPETFKKSKLKRNTQLNEEKSEKSHNGNVQRQSWSEKKRNKMTRNDVNKLHNANEGTFGYNNESPNQEQHQRKFKHHHHEQTISINGEGKKFFLQSKSQHYLKKQAKRRQESTMQNIFDHDDHQLSSSQGSFTSSSNSGKIKKSKTPKVKKGGEGYQYSAAKMMQNLRQQKENQKALEKQQKKEEDEKSHDFEVMENPQQRKTSIANLIFNRFFKKESLHNSQDDYAIDHLKHGFDVDDVILEDRSSQENLDSMSLTTPVNAQRNKGNTLAWQQIQSEQETNIVEKQKPSKKRVTQFHSYVPPGSNESEEQKGIWKQGNGKTTDLLKKNERNTVDTKIEDIYEQMVRTSGVRIVKYHRMSLQDVVGTLMKKSSNNKQLTSQISKMSFGKLGGTPSNRVQIQQIGSDELKQDLEEEKEATPAGCRTTNYNKRTIVFEDVDEDEEDQKSHLPQMMNRNNTKLNSHLQGSSKMNLEVRPTFLGVDQNSFKLSSNDLQSYQSQSLNDDKSNIGGQIVPSRKYQSQMYAKAQNFRNFKHSNTSSFMPLQRIKSNLTFREIFEKRQTQDVIKMANHQLTKQLTVQNIALKRQESNKFVGACVKIVTHKAFSKLMVLIIGLNILTISLDSNYFEYDQILEICNMVFASVYILELGLKIAAYGPKGFFQSSHCAKYDYFIALFCLLDLMLSDLLVEDRPFMAFIVSTRALRIFKLTNYWENLQIVMETFKKSILQIGGFGSMLIMVHYIYTLNGMALFDQRAKFNSNNEVDLVEGNTPMFNFNGFMNSLLTVFIVMTNDGQSAIYYNYYRAVGATSATLYWVTFVVIVQKVLVNMFSAILLHWHKDVKDRFNLIKKQQKELQAQEQLEKEKKSSSENGSVGGDLTEKKEPGRVQRMVEKVKEGWKKFKNLKVFGFKKESKEKESAFRDPYKNNKNQLRVSGRSLSYLNEDSLLRQWLHKMLQSPIFDLMIVGVIIISSVSLALDTPTLDPESNQKQTLQWLDISTIIIFSFEAFSKIVAYGFVFNGVDSYLRNFWNIMDFIVLMFSYLCLSPQAEQFRFIKVLRILRSLRLISRNDGLKVAVRAFLSAIPNILGMTVIMTIFFIIFGVISVHHFRGRLYYCTNEIPLSESVLKSKWDCLNLGGLWVNRTFNFDNIVNALITLFTMSTTAGWAEMMIHTISSTEIDYIPDFTTRSTYWIMFYMLFMIVLTFFFMNLFGAVVINTFMEQTNRLAGGIFLTHRQKEWIDIRKMIIRTTPMKKHQPASDTKFRMFFFKLQSHRYFDRFIFVNIVLSTLLLMLKWYKQSDAMDDFTEIMNIVFTFIFFMEVIIRILGIGIKNYFGDPWGRFDFSIAIGSLISLLLYKQSSIKIKFLSFIKGFKILRLIRLLNRGGRTLSLVFNTFIITMQQLSNIGGLLFLFMYMYSILGMIYFGEVKRNGSMNDYINFENFTSAFITLFTVATADSWNYTTASFTWDSQPNNKCIENPSYQDYVNNNNQTIGCSTRESAFIFFISFMYIFSMVFLRIFITTIIQGYQETRVQDDRIFNFELCQRFKECWAEFDPNGTSFIKLCDLRAFLFLLGSPLGFDESYRQNRFKQDRFIALLDLPIYNSFSNYYFTDVLDSLSFRAMVLDQLQQLYKDENDDDDHNDEQGGTGQQEEHGGGNKFNQQDKIYHEQRIKKKLEREVNRLIYNKQSDQIIEFQEMFQQEMQKKMKMVDQDEDLGRFTSQHHMAIEAAIRKIKLLLEASRQRKAQSEQNAVQPTSQDGEVVASNSSPNIKKSSMYKMFSLALKIKKKIGSNKKLMNLQSQQKRMVGSQNDVVPRNRNESELNMAGENQLPGAATVFIPRMTYQP